MAVTTVQDITRWFERGAGVGNTHMVVVTDTFDYEDYPVYVSSGEDVHGVVEFYRAATMSKVMEVYSYSVPFDEQVTKPRAFFF